jgi:archaetidylinositol phosphate synthase
MADWRGLARIGNMMSRGGHIYDYYADNLVNAAFFVSIGIGLRHSWLGSWAIVLGLVSGLSMFLCSLFSEWLELRSPAGTRAYSGRWGFDPDDAFYLMGPLAWLECLSPILIGASVGTTVMMVVTGSPFSTTRFASLDLTLFAERSLNGVVGGPNRPASFPGRAASDQM